MTTVLHNRWFKKMMAAILLMAGAYLFISFTAEAMAQGLSIPSSEILSEDIAQDRPFAEIALGMINYFVGLLGFLATAAFVYAGVLWVLSGGAEEQITKAKKIMTYAGLGMIVVLLSFSIVTFIAGSAGGGEGTSDPVSCTTDADCSDGWACATEAGVCVNLGGGGDDDDLDSDGDGIPDSEDPDADGDGIPDSIDADVETFGDGTITSGPDGPVVDENIEEIDELMDGLEEALDIDEVFTEEETEQLNDAIEEVLGEGQTIDSILESGTMEDKIANLEALINDPSTPEELVEKLEAIQEGLENLGLLRLELNELRENMPESQETIEAYDETSEALDSLIEDPTSEVKYRRFETRYKNIKDLIKKFPYVLARIRAVPGIDNVPFTVQLDGLNSSDPTGGTISEYKWIYLDNSGNEVSLGSEPVVVTEFTEPNTYVVKLRVATSNIDDEGFKTAMDGVSTIRIKANPPASKVSFRINGNEAGDVENVTLSEAQTGISFDPSISEPALGRKLELYEWSYGDTATETRKVPTTVIHSYDKTGEYFVKLLVTDNIGVKDKKIIKLNVKSLAASVHIIPTSGNVNTEFSFAGSSSRSDDGVILDYEWEVKNDEGRVVVESDDSIFFHRFERPGSYEVTLVVTDITGASDKIIKVFNVLSREPVASFNFDFPEQNHPNRVEFNAVDSYDPDVGDLITYSWDFDGDGEFDLLDSKEALVIHEYKKIGEYRPKLQIQDSFGKRDQVEKKISVQSILSADIETKSRATRVGTSIVFNSKSPNSIAYLWEFGDGETVSTEGTSVEHTYAKTGKYTVKLNFFDEDDNDNVDTMRILVGAGDQPLSVINFLLNGREARLTEDLCSEGAEGAVVTRADMIRFDARGSINTDGSSRLLSYDWRFPGGEKSSKKESSFKFDEINLEGECFSISLAVRDQLTGKLSEIDEVYFKVINRLPEITDFVITPPEGDGYVTPSKVKLRVINSKDYDGSIKKYKWWYYLEGFEDERLGLHNTAVADTEMIITSFGQAEVVNRYFFAVEIVDNDGGLYNSEERFGEVSYLDVANGPNLSPVAEFTVDKTTISVGDSITFISRSYDPQGEDLPSDAFRWDFDGDGEFDDTSSGGQVNRQFNTPGEYDVRLKVVHRGLSSSTNKTVFVETTNALPQAAFTFKIEGNEVNFDGGHSRFDPDMEDPTLRFEWDFDIEDDANGNGVKDDDVQSTDMRPTYAYPEKGVYKAKLKVKDVLGMEGVVVRDVNLNLTESERRESAYNSLKVDAPKHPLTTLDIEVLPATLVRGSTADITVVVLNADGTPYKGQVFFELLNGSGEFTPNPVDAEDSKASAIFSSTEKGKVRLRVRATGTLYGELTEEATLTVK